MLKRKRRTLFYYLMDSRKSTTDLNKQHSKSEAVENYINKLNLNKQFSVVLQPFLFVYNEVD